ncbi:extracellular solute-binding protein [Paenibacillus terrigena]|uniref:extracellular solute-binding protein n=1 Tax=Paenibacillus terrigena TaxID=369333 RepID=UPI000369083E|nr:extracellular solute-binding protein [Paenibacillus terrigena]
MYKRKGRGCRKTDIKSSNVFTDYFLEKYGNLFMMKYPNITLEPVEIRPEDIYNPEKYEKMLSESSPDILDLNLVMYNHLIEKGFLYSLDVLMKQNDFDIDNYFPGVIEILKQNDGQLYGLSPDFSTDALYFNRELFEEFKIPLPTDKMSWTEILDLAKRFPNSDNKGNKIYGFSMNSLFGFYGLFNSIGVTSGLQQIDKKESALGTSEWKKIFVNAVEAYRAGAVQPGVLDEQPEDLFIQGRVAMQLNSSQYIKTMKSEKEFNKNFKPFQWGIVTYPINPNNNEYSDRVSVDHIFSITKNTIHLSEAWKFISYINSEEVAKLQSRTLSSDILSRPGLMTESGLGIDVSAFYKLKPIKSSLKKGVGFGREHYVSINTEAQNAIDGKKTVDEAYENIIKQSKLELKESLAK